MLLIILVKTKLVSYTKLLITLTIGYANHTSSYEHNFLALLIMSSFSNVASYISLFVPRRSVGHNKGFTRRPLGHGNQLVN